MEHPRNRNTPKINLEQEKQQLRFCKRRVFGATCWSSLLYHDIYHSLSVLRHRLVIKRMRIGSLASLTTVEQIWTHWTWCLPQYRVDRNLTNSRFVIDTNTEIGSMYLAINVMLYSCIVLGKALSATDNFLEEKIDESLKKKLRQVKKCEKVSNCQLSLTCRSVVVQYSLTS